MRREVINMLLYGVPLCMAVGLSLKEYTNSLKVRNASLAHLLACQNDMVIRLRVLLAGGR
jgi:hypothetical protein